MKHKEESATSISKPAFSRKDLLRLPEYWEEYIKVELFNLVQDYMDEKGLTRTDLARNLGVSKGYVSQVLNGNSDHRLSKIVALAIECGKAPCIYFRDLDKVIEEDSTTPKTSSKEKMV